MNRYKFNSKYHYHSLDNKPLIGTTKALGIMSKPLTYWAAGMACAEFGWLNHKKFSMEDCILNAGKYLEMIRSMSNRQYYNLLDKAYHSHNTKKEKSASEGIDLHEHIENYIKARLRGIENPVVIEKIVPFVLWSKENVKNFVFSEMNCYSEVLWCGGIADFAYIDNQGNLVLGDIKSSKKDYFSQWVQLGAYDLQLSENGGFNYKGERVFELHQSIKYHAIFAAGKGLDKPLFNYQIDRTKRAFSYAINLYRESMFFNGDK